MFKIYALGDSVGDTEWKVEKFSMPRTLRLVGILSPDG